MTTAKFFCKLATSVWLGILGLLLGALFQSTSDNPSMASAENLAGINLGTLSGLILGWFLGGFLRKKYLLWRHPCGGGQEDAETVWPWWPQ